MPRVTLPDRCVPGIDNGVLLDIGLSAPQSPSDPGVMAFVTSREQHTINVYVMVEAPDFTCTRGWKHTLAVTKDDPFTPTIQLHLVPLAPDDMTVRLSIVRVHYSYHGQPAGLVTRRIALGDATLEEAQALAQPVDALLQIAPTATPVDLTIRISRRDASDSARELIWTLMDCAHPITLPNEPITQKVGDRDTASSFASKVTSQVNAADGTVTIDSMLRGIGTLIRRAMPAPVLQALLDVAAAVGTSRLARILLLTDECFIPWELALMEPAPNAARASFLGAQFAVSRWIHGEADVPVPPPATLTVSNLAVVLGKYDASSLAALPHAKEESDALLSQAVNTPTRFPHVTSVNASPDALVDLLNGKLPSYTGTIAPEMVHFACHGEVLGSGVSKRSVLYMSDGSPLSEILFVASALGKTTKSFLFMNACQVGVGGDELGQYAGFPGMAIGAGFSGFVGPLWSVNDQLAKGIALDFYNCSLGADGSAPRAVADVLADMRSQYASEPDPKKRQSTWLAYVHYGHPHFTFTHA
jgi:CHAT domain